MGCALDPADLVPGKAGYVERRMRKVGRDGSAAHLRSDAPTSADLHGANVHCVGAWEYKCAFALLYDEARHAAPTEIDREPEPDRTGAHDQDGNIDALSILQ